MNEHARIMVRFCPPRYGKPVEVWLDLEEYYAKCFQPLPRDRELYDEPIICGAFSDEQRMAVRKQVADRSKLAEYLTPKLVKGLVDAITKQDTINGYAQDE